MPFQPSLPDRKWIARFDGSAYVFVGEDDWSVLARTVEEMLELERKVLRAVEHGWPSLAGWDIDTSPGWDDEWNYLRLYALGAKKVVGPNPGADEFDDLKDEPGIVIG